jgi:hypothetical protein
METGTKMSKKSKGLGMGLDALLGDTSPADPSVPTDTDINAPESASPANNKIPLEHIQAGEYRPRGQLKSTVFYSRS